MIDRNTLSVWIPGGLAFGLSFSGIETCLKLMLLTVTIGYTLWKWNKEAREK